jgi:two-component system cell cycle sensor histidine kinase/response regulator CckA
MIERPQAPCIVSMIAGTQPVVAPEPQAGDARGCDRFAADELESASLHLQRTALLGRVASGYVHDLDTVLMVIDLCAYAAAGSLPPGHPALAELETLQHACGTAKNLSSRLLSFVRRRPPAPRVVDLRRAVETSLPMLRALAGRNMRIVAALDPGLWPILADPVQIDQILLNLLVNARNAMPDGGVVTIHAANVCAGDDEGVDPGEYVRLAVSDSGAGVAADVLERMFEPFYSGQRSGEGVGLGLSTCRYLVRQLGGEISVATVLGGGTTFSMLFPRTGR